MASDDEILAEEKGAFEDSASAESENRIRALDSLRMWRLGEQWPLKIKNERELENRPCLTINHGPSFIRQVVNDSRQNKPQIKVKPVDSGADPATANVYGDIIRNIESQSKADIAYDTAVDFAASMGWGYIRLAVEYEYDDSFDKCLRIQAVENPFSVYGDANATGATSENWNRAFVTDLMPRDDFKAKYKGAEEVDWSGAGYDALNAPWRQEQDSILVCESWLREKVKSKILLLSDGSVAGEKEYKQGKDLFDELGITVEQERPSESYKITQRIMTGAEVIETNDWAGRYIPIIPIYGDEVNVEGKRHFFSLLHHAQDAQRMFNYWRTNATELVALAPRVPFIGEEGAFNIDPEKWKTANTKNHAYLEVKKGKAMPQRQQIDVATAAGSMSQALMASDDMKAIIGLYDASLGKRSNETSGVAIQARDRQGDVSTFHFADNLNRGIRHLGCCCVDLIPKTYGTRQMMRITGADGKERQIKIGARPQRQPLNPPEMPQGPQNPQEMEKPLTHESTGMEHVYDLSVGKYDVVIDTGPSYTTKREEVSAQMAEFLKAFPAAAPYVGDIFVKALDWPQAEEIAKRLNAMMPQQAQGGMPPELQQLIEGGKAQIMQQGKQLEQLTQELHVVKVEKQLADKANAIKLQEKDLVIQKMQALEAIEEAAEQAAQNAMPQEKTEPQQQQAPQINLTIPEGLGTALGNAVLQGTQQIMANMPPLNVNMPAIKRTPVHYPDNHPTMAGRIMHTIDEPAEQLQ